MAVEEIDFKVRGFVSDMGPSNHKLLSDLSTESRNTFVSNSYCPNKKIWALCDIPHGLKLVRNLLDYGHALTN